MLPYTEPTFVPLGPLKEFDCTEKPINNILIQNLKTDSRYDSLINYFNIIMDLVLLFRSERRKTDMRKEKWRGNKSEHKIKEGRKREVKREQETEGRIKRDKHKGNKKEKKRKGKTRRGGSRKEKVKRERRN